MLDALLESSLSDSEEEIHVRKSKKKGDKKKKNIKKGEGKEVKRTINSTEQVGQEMNGVSISTFGTRQQQPRRVPATISQTAPTAAQYLIELTMNGPQRLPWQIMDKMEPRQGEQRPFLGNCIVCQVVGHPANECLQRVCYSCRQQVYYSTQCPNRPQQRTYIPTCQVCGERGAVFINFQKCAAFRMLLGNWKGGGRITFSQSQEPGKK